MRQSASLALCHRPGRCIDALQDPQGVEHHQDGRTLVDWQRANTDSVARINSATTTQAAHRFCWTMVCAARLNAIANGDLDRSSANSATSAVSSATSVPELPMAMSIVACAQPARRAFESGFHQRAAMQAGKVAEVPSCAALGSTTRRIWLLACIGRRRESAVVGMRRLSFEAVSWSVRSRTHRVGVDQVSAMRRLARTPPHRRQPGPQPDS